jgi:excisionase family DNA binding protein
LPPEGGAGDELEQNGEISFPTVGGEAGRLLRVDQAAKVLALGRTKVYEMVAAGELPVVRIGTAVRIPLNALERWITERMVGSR